jgi:AbrB family looped-hinge helix DNA binding protein
MSIDTKIGEAGRVVVPAPIRHMLGLQAVDRIEFIVSGDRVVLAPSRARLAAVWANNQGGDARDSALDMRAERGRDLAAQEEKWARVEARAAAEDRTEDQIAADLLGSLGLTRPASPSNRPRFSP